MTVSAEGRVENQKLNQTAALLSFGWVFGFQPDSLKKKNLTTLLGFTFTSFERIFLLETNMKALEDIEVKNSASNAALLETFEKSSTALASQLSSGKSELQNEKSEDFRTNFKEGSDFHHQKVPEYVCFVGKFPKTATLSDIQNFVKSNGINFTGVRVGPKKKPNANVFGYVDLPTKEDYDKLLALNRSL